MQVVAWGFFVVFSAMDLQETDMTVTPGHMSLISVLDKFLNLTLATMSLRSDLTFQGFCRCLQLMGVSL